MTHAEFAAWMDGYLAGLGDDRLPSTILILDKMSQIKASTLAPVYTGVYDTRQYMNGNSTAPVTSNVTPPSPLSYEQFKSILEGK